MRAKKSLGAVLAALAASASLPGGAAALTRHVPGEFATIGEALAAADSGDVILVEPGSYAESIVLAEGRGDGVTVQSSGGAEVTTISYPEGERPDPNESVVTFQRCSDATRFEGFTVDGRDVARRGVLVNSNAKPVLTNLVIRGCEYGVSSHRGSRPIVESVRVLESRTAGLFVQDASAEVRGAELTDGAKFGVYVDGTQDTLRLRDLAVARNAVGLQVLAGDVLVDGGAFSANSQAGMIFRGVSPEVRGAVIESQPQVGIVLERCGGGVFACTIRGNRFGLVAAIDGAPAVRGCTFQDNSAYHLGAEGDAAPLVGGSLEGATRFLGTPGTAAIRSSSSAAVDATHNDWGTACPDAAWFRRDGAGELLTSPWTYGDPPAVVATCEDAGGEAATTPE
ncbi:MAG: right-handed parallel beta-helix repeat-containing protein [Candidatus Eiseniibacteriota bacterium]